MHCCIFLTSVIEKVADMPDSETPEVSIGPDPVEGDEGGEDDAVEGDDSGFVDGDRKQISKLDHGASANRCENYRDESSSECHIMGNLLDTFDRAGTLQSCRNGLRANLVSPAC